MHKKVEIKHLHIFCGLGGGAAGFNKGEARVGNLEASFRCVGGIDVDAAAIRDFEKLAGVPGTVMDMFSRDQYINFHGKQPPADWREANAQDIQKAAGYENPNIVFLSAPCKGFSGLLSQAKSSTDKYKALNELTLRGIWLTLEAFANDPSELILFENVPRIASRGRYLLDQIRALLESYGYVVAETTHDCGELGGLAQSRRRFLLVARHREKVPAFLYEPTKRPLRSVGEVLSRMPMPVADLSNPMHRVPRLQWKTWVRLAFVEAGSDWRSLKKLAVENGHLKDFLIIPESRDGYLGVHHWNETAGAIAGRSTATNGKFSVADPRGNSFGGKYKVTKFTEASSTVISNSSTGHGAFAVSDPRIDLTRDHPYGVVRWGDACGAIASSGKYDNGKFSVADPRLPELDVQLVAVIRSLDGTWHRPFTTLEKAAFQGLYDPDDEGTLILHGSSDTDWCERIGNAVPPPAAQAIASMMGETLLLAWLGESFVLSSTPIWVRNVAIAISVDQSQPMECLQ